MTLPADIDGIDGYGFLLSKKETSKKLDEINTPEYRDRIRLQNKRIHKWLNMINEWDVYYNGNKKAKLKSRIRKGIPAPIRSLIWKKLLNVDEIKLQNQNYYKELKLKAPSNYKKAIDNDLDRTFPTHYLFYDSESYGQDSLKNVLYAYSVHDPKIGYCQGMGFVTGVLLMMMTEEDAFFALVALLSNQEDNIYELRGCYEDSLPLLKQRHYQFELLLENFLPDLYGHFKLFKINPEFYTSIWFMTLFSCDFPFDFVLRIWDCYLYEGIKFIFRISLGLLKYNHDNILAIKTFGNCLEYLQHIHTTVNIDNINAILYLSTALPLKTTHIQQYKILYDEHCQELLIKSELHKQVKEQPKKENNENKDKDNDEKEYKDQDNEAIKLSIIKEFGSPKSNFSNSDNDERKDGYKIENHESLPLFNNINTRSHQLSDTNDNTDGQSMDSDSDHGNY